MMATTNKRVGVRGIGAQYWRLAVVVWGFLSSAILKALRAKFFISFAVDKKDHGRNTVKAGTGNAAGRAGRDATAGAAGDRPAAERTEKAVEGLVCRIHKLEGGETGQRPPCGNGHRNIPPPPENTPPVVRPQKTGRETAYQLIRFRQYHPEGLLHRPQDRRCGQIHNDRTQTCSHTRGTDHKPPHPLRQRCRGADEQ